MTASRSAFSGPCGWSRSVFYSQMRSLAAGSAHQFLLRLVQFLAHCLFMERKSLSGSSPRALLGQQLLLFFFSTVVIFRSRAVIAVPDRRPDPEICTFPCTRRPWPRHRPPSPGKPPAKAALILPRRWGKRRRRPPPLFDFVAAYPLAVFVPLLVLGFPAVISCAAVPYKTACPSKGLAWLQIP